MENKQVPGSKTNQPEKYDSDLLNGVVIQAINMTCEDIIKAHKNLTEKKFINDDYIGDYGRSFMTKLLSFDYGYCFPKEMPKGLEQFFNSKYFSDNFKTILKEIIEKTPSCVPELLNSEKSLSEFTEEEFNDIASTCRHISYDNIMIILALKLNSEGARNFLMNRVDPMTLIERIVLTSGLNDRAEYYSGRGALMCDFNGEHLISIYNKLAKLDSHKALNMAKMALNMPTLGATEFLESLYNLAQNDYKLDETTISTNNVSLGSTRDEERTSISIASIASFLCGSRRDETFAIKSQFLNLLPQEIVERIFIDGDTHIYGEYDSYGIQRYEKTRKRYNLINKIFE